MGNRPKIRDGKRADRVVGAVEKCICQVVFFVLYNKYLLVFSSKEIIAQGGEYYVR